MRKQAASAPITARQGSYQLRRRLAGQGALSPPPPALPFTPAAAAPDPLPRPRARLIPRLRRDAEPSELNEDWQPGNGSKP